MNRATALANVLPLFPPEPKCFIAPTLEEVKLHAAKIGLPELEAEKFWHYYESQGWKVSKNAMKKWHSAIAGWKLRWQERQGHIGPRPVRQETAGQRMFVLATQLEQVEKKMTDLCNAVPTSANGKLWSKKERDDYQSLKNQKAWLQAEIAKVKPQP